MKMRYLMLAGAWLSLSQVSAEARQSDNGQMGKNGILATQPKSLNSRDYGRPADTPETRANSMLRQLASCAIDRVPGSARKVLATQVGSDDEERQVRKMIGVARECYDQQQPEYLSTVLRDALAEATYRTLYMANAPKLGPESKKLPDTFAVVPATQKGTPVQEASWYLAALANCTVFVNSSDARQLVLGPTDVPEEQTRFTKLEPSIRQCTPKGGQAPTLRQIRGPLAQALLVQANQAGKAN